LTSGAGSGGIARWHQQEAAPLAGREVRLEQQGIADALGRQDAAGGRLDHGHRRGRRLDLDAFVGAIKIARVGGADRLRRHALQQGHAVDLAARHQEGADAVGFAGVGREGARCAADRLDVGQLAVRLDLGVQGIPGAAHGRLVGRAVQQALVDAPGQRIREQAGAAGLLHRIAGRVEQAGAPQAVLLLQAHDLRGHLLELLLEARAGRVVRRQVLQGARQAGHHPAVAARPEHLGAVGFALVEVVAVAVVEVLGLVVQVVRSAPPLRDRVLEIALVAGGGVQAHPGGRSHEQGVAPRPAVLVAGFRELQRAFVRIARMPSNCARRGASISGWRSCR
jgi:hypothetical protein